MRFDLQLPDLQIAHRVYVKLNIGNNKQINHKKFYYEIRLFYI